MNEPLISVVVPAYNLEALLPAALDSLLAQTCSELEILVVNDGSTDGTGAVLDRYAAADPRIRAIHKENGGVTSARLRGIREARGQWIGFMDGDDYVEPEMYARLLANGLAHNADISHCGYRMVFPNRVDDYYNTGRLVLQDHVSGLRDLLTGIFVEPGLWNKLYRRELFRNLEEKMDRTLKINEDLLMNYWLFRESSSAVYEDFCPYHYIVRKGSAANSALSEHKLWDSLKVAEQILADVPGSLRPEALRKRLRVLITGASMDAAEAPELIRPYRAHCRKELRRDLPVFLQKDACGGKLKLMALWTAVWPASYGWVHSLYSRVTGLDKKYDME